MSNASPPRGMNDRRSKDANGTNKQGVIPRKHQCQFPSSLRTPSGPTLGKQIRTKERRKLFNTYAELVGRFQSGTRHKAFGNVGARWNRTNNVELSKHSSPPTKNSLDYETTTEYIEYRLNENIPLLAQF